jgi:anti-sigma regulatory factor (Ser/Thr protein kinase)
MGLFDETDRTRLGVALTEALLNAIFHGNLGVSSDLREQGLADYFALAKQRTGEQPYCDRRVRVDARWTRTDCRFVIRDEGDGFDVASLPDPTDPSNLERASGRGVLLMQMFMNEVRFNDTGNEVTMVKRTDCESA